MKVCPNTYLKAKLSLHDMKDNKWWTILSVFIDLGFFLGFAYVYTEIFLKVSSNLNTVNRILTEELPKLQTATNVNSVLLGNAEFAAAYKGILGYIALTLLALYVFWTVFQGINWFIAQKMNKEMKFWTYMKKFSLLNIFWLGAFLLITTITGFLLSKSVTSPIPIFGQDEIQIVVGILGIVLLYFMFISYGLITKDKVLKRTFKLGLNKGVITWFLIVITTLVLANYLLVKTFNFDVQLVIAYVLLIFLPALVFVRVFTVKAISTL